jgi:hypothetical protein
MTGKADAALKQLSSSAQSLNRVSDELSAYLKQIETSLASYRLGIHAWVDLSKKPIYEDGGAYIDTAIGRLGYDKLKGKWALLVASWIEGAPDETHNVQLLRDAPREIRIEAVDKLPNLLEELSRQAAKTTDKAERSLATARDLAKALAPKESK